MSYIIDYDTLAIIYAIIVVIIIAFRTVKKKKIDKKFILRICFVTYAYVVIAIVAFPIIVPPLGDMEQQVDINYSVLHILDYPSFKILIINVIGNLFILMPLFALAALNGMYISRNVMRGMIFVFLISLSIELIQYLEVVNSCNAIVRSIDINDIILNTVGGTIGTYLGLRLKNRNANL